MTWGSVKWEMIHWWWSGKSLCTLAPGQSQVTRLSTQRRDRLIGPQPMTQLSVTASSRWGHCCRSLWVHSLAEDRFSMDSVCQWPCLLCWNEVIYLNLPASLEFYSLLTLPSRYVQGKDSSKWLYCVILTSSGHIRKLDWLQLHGYLKEKKMLRWCFGLTCLHE